MSDPEEQLADALAAIDEAPCGLMRTDADGLFLRVNRTFCRWVGWEAAELVERRRLQDLLTMGGRIFHQTHWEPLLQMQGSVSEVKLEIVHHDGHTIPMVLNAVRRGRHGQLVHELAAYVARDRDQYERELVLSRRKLEAAVADARRAHADAKDRALVAEQMTGVVSHDLRNPLSTIHMGTILLERIGVTAQQQEVLARIGRATARANRLISDLLDFTQARLGPGLQVAPRPADLHRLVHESIDELSLAFPGRTITHVESGAGACRVDPDRLAQLIGNLVGNAMAYGDDARPVTVESAAGRDEFSVSVHNWGAPIPAHTLATVFEPLSRGHGPSREGRSLGLGLYIVDAIAKAHGGQVQVTSSSESGTTFSARFPRRPAA